MFNPRNKVYKVWATMLIAMDAIYTAFIVPISVGFRASDTQWNWIAVTDFTAGAPAICSFCDGKRCGHTDGSSDSSIRGRAIQGSAVHPHTTWCRLAVIQQRSIAMKFLSVFIRHARHQRR